jgi:SAM-dependent methyltransferase
MTEEGTDPTGRISGDTADAEYAARLQRLGGRRWKRILNVQAPYRWNIRRFGLGRTLDIGCGLGRNLLHLDGNGVGVDHNAESVAECRRRGLTAYTVEEFPRSGHAVAGSFDSMLLAHVLEHVDRETADGMLFDYLKYVRPGGQVVFITPQESGYKSDSTHVRWVDFTVLRDTAQAHGLEVTRTFSFPLPRIAGKVFTYNEFVQVARIPSSRIPS